MRRSIEKATVKGGRRPVPAATTGRRSRIRPRKPWAAFWVKPCGHGWTQKAPGEKSFLFARCSFVLSGPVGVWGRQSHEAKGGWTLANRVSSRSALSRLQMTLAIVSTNCCPSGIALTKCRPHFRRIPSSYVYILTILGLSDYIGELFPS